MSTAMKPQEYADVLHREYLADFVKAGGAAVKFAVPLEPDARDAVVRAVAGHATSEGYLVLDVSAAGTRVHMIDQIFHRLAEQVPWRELCRRLLGSIANRAAYDPPATEAGAFLDGLAAANDLDRDFLLNEMRKEIVRSVFRDTAMAKDFRVAMTNLMQAELTGGPEGETTFEVIVAWLTGEVRSVSAVKPYGIRSRVMRNNARHFLESLAHWVRKCGRAGIVVMLDLERLAVPRNPRDGYNYYTKASLLDVYEVLRQFIDGTDRLEGCLLFVVPDASFLETDKSARGMATYEALMFRIYDEIRDRELVNPMASLVRLEGVS
jgi:hypothetical protein